MYMMAYAVNLLANTVHQVRLLIYIIGYAVHLISNAVHPSEAPDVQMASVEQLMTNAVHLLANAVHLTEAPDVHDRICSTLDG